MLYTCINTAQVCIIKNKKVTVLKQGNDFNCIGSHVSRKTIHDILLHHSSTLLNLISTCAVHNYQDSETVSLRCLVLVVTLDMKLHGYKVKAPTLSFHLHPYWAPKLEEPRIIEEIIILKRVLYKI